jgi:hypothetical protein
VRVFTLPHDSATCDCAEKARRVVVCSVVQGAVDNYLGNMVVREGCGEYVVPIRVELFAWGAAWGKERPRRFASWARGEV